MKLWSPIAGVLFIFGSLVVLVAANVLLKYPLFFPTN
jgi:hypothetical protein